MKQGAVSEIIKILRHIYRSFCYEEIKSSYYLKKKKKYNNKKIRVGFISQMPEVWDKQAGLFEAMLLDDRFDPYIIVVPMYDFISKHIEKKSEYLWYKNKYESRVYEYPVQEQFSIYNKKQRFDFVFYDRPYDEYLPLGIRSGVVMKSTTICMVNYCIADCEMYDFAYYSFAQHVSLWFASNRLEVENYKKGYLQKSYRKVYDIGYPAFEYYRITTNPDFCVRFLWTPRWSTQEDGFGATSFFKYLDSFVYYFTTHENVSLVIRPHPLMFDNFVSKGIMSESEVFSLKKSLSEKGITFDDNREIRDTFIYTDVLISDYSSVISLFMISEKAVIYCPCDLPVSDSFKKLSSVMYISNDWEDVEKNLNNLSQGVDPALADRKRIVDEELHRKKNATKRIMNVISRTFNYHNQ